MASEDNHLHLSCESSDFEEDQILPENASCLRPTAVLVWTLHIKKPDLLTDDIRDLQWRINLEKIVDCWALLMIFLIFVVHFFFLIKKIHVHTYHRTRGQNALP